MLRGGEHSVFRIREPALSVLRIKPFVLWFGAIAGFALDQFTKFWVTSAFRLEETLPVFPDLLSITYKLNTGAAFGLFRGRPIGFFLSISAIAVCVITYFVVRVSPDRVRLAWAMALILGGALGNISDRLRLGGVVDFIDFRYQDRVWPTFNVADVVIVVGVVLFLWDMARSEAAVPSPADGTESRDNPDRPETLRVKPEHDLS